MLPKTPTSWSRNFREFVVAVDADDRVVGCGALRVYTESLAEIVSLAVDESAHGAGSAARIVEPCGEDGPRPRDLTTVFALTLRDEFFHRLGFRTVPKELFPLKVWADCRSCPKLHACDEIAVARRNCDQAPYAPAGARTLRARRRGVKRRGESRPTSSTSTRISKHMNDTVVLAYSGGLDTSIIVPVAAGELRALRWSASQRTWGRARSWTGWLEGARLRVRVECVVEDLREEFLTEVRLADAAGGRDLRAEVPPGHVHGASDHRAQPGPARGAGRRLGARSRLHREGERPGPLRAHLRRALRRA
jgi:amino-acid N-acetyltransferase